MPAQPPLLEPEVRQRVASKWIATILVATLSISGVALAQSSVQTNRLAGEARVGTAVAIAQHGFPNGAQIVYLGRSDDPVDAIAAGTLTDGPILLVPACGTLPDAVANEIRRLSPQQIIALGGSAAVCDSIVDQATLVATETAEEGPRLRISATARLLDDRGHEIDPSNVPLSIEASDPGSIVDGDQISHEVRLTGTDGDVDLDGPRFSGISHANGGQLVVAGPDCGPADGGDGLTIACDGYFEALQLSEGAVIAVDVTIHTMDGEVGEAPLTEGEYSIDTPIAYGPRGQDNYANRVIARVTYTVDS